MFRVWGWKFSILSLGFRIAGLRFREMGSKFRGWNRCSGYWFWGRGKDSSQVLYHRSVVVLMMPLSTLKVIK